ncbi:MAG: hypothetical protein KatS3mg129_2689 [Leptospiraceae bacterium]|nr:MAG: hypothetical protein KatS3mg129_2689 [Leptospiraceae bacterium]
MIEPENLLFQTGYLTIRGLERMPTGYLYYLSYPNKEVEISLNHYILMYYTQEGHEASRLVVELIRGLSVGDIGCLKDILQSLFRGIPYEWYRRNEISSYEGYYASVVYSFLVGGGFEIIAEDYTSCGRIDLTLLYGDRCYIMEFKVMEIEGGGKAIEQIRGKGYGEKYRGRYREVYLIGIEFSREKKEIVGFDWERF